MWNIWNRINNIGENIIGAYGGNFQQFLGETEKQIVQES